MSRNNGFFSWLLRSFFDRSDSTPPARTAATSPAAQPAPPQDAPADADFVKEPAVADPSRRVYNGEYPPTRMLYLWGRDDAGTPGFLMLCGEQGLKDNLLDEAVSYKHAIVFRGAEGHFPSFEAIKILDSTNYKTRETTRNLYYKKDVRGNGYYYADSKHAIPGFAALAKPISLPYFAGLSHGDFVVRVRAAGIVLPGFTLVEDPGEVLQLPTELLPYRDTLLTLFSSPSLYMRKKALTALFEQDPPAALWKHLHSVGSSELVAGLYLEMSRRRCDVLLEEARAAASSPITWTADSYAAGIRRCATLYRNAFDQPTIEKRLAHLRDTLSELRLQPLKVGGRSIPEDSAPDGATYRKYCLQGMLADFYYTYNRQLRQSERRHRDDLYPQGYYCDGASVDILKIKNTIQESLTYGAADILGKMAYYLDAPGLVYHMQANSKSKSLRYFRRLLTRIFNELAATDEERFMDAMEALFTAYQPGDYLCKYRGNFQFNYFIKRYLYAGFDATPPVSWRERYMFMSADQLLRQEGRQEYMPEVWNRHLGHVVRIALGARIEVVQKAAYNILSDAANREAAVASLGYEELLRLAEAGYAPLSEMGVTLLQGRLAAEPAFRAELMALLMRAESPAVRELAQAYFARAGGVFSPQDLAGLLLMPDLASWQALLSDGVAALDGSGIVRFLAEVFRLDAKLDGWDGALGEILDSVLDRLVSLSPSEAAELLAEALPLLRGSLTAELRDYIGRIVFSFPADTLRELTAQPQLAPLTAGPAGDPALVLLAAIRSGSLPTDGIIIEILETGSPQMVRALTEVLEAGAGALQGRFTTVLLLLESDQSALNRLAKAAFEGLSGEAQEKLHLMLLDSPQQRAYSYAIEQLHRLYESRDVFIPESFIIRMLEHPAADVKDFISRKIAHALEGLGGGNTALFLYYARTLLLLPNRLSGGKDRVYAALPPFVRQYGDTRPAVEALLLELGGSNIILDCERALVTLAEIRKEAV